MKLWDRVRRNSQPLAWSVYAFLAIGAVALPVILYWVSEDQKFWATLGAAIAAVGGSVLANVVERWVHPVQAHTPDEARRQYLRGLRAQCQLLPLAALGGGEGLDETLRLDQVYIALDTTAQEPVSSDDDPFAGPSGGDGAGRPDQETVPLSARAALGQSPRWVLLGDPGGGKSTFVRQILAELATCQELGTEPEPDLPGDLLPVLINLRELTSKLDPESLQAQPPADQRQMLARLLRDQAVADLAGLEAEGFASGLRHEIETGRCFLVLDGLDEMPELVRPWAREVVQAVIGVYGMKKVVVTCRVRSYVAGAVLPDFQAHRLAPFSAEKIQDFVSAWYQAQRRLGKVQVDQVASRSADLMGAALSADLRELSSNPMLLTTMAMIHQRDIGLPRERVRLYERTVELLLRRWEEYRGGTTGLTPDAELAGVLSNERLLRSIMEVLAYEAHGQESSPGAGGELTRGQALTLIDHPPYLANLSLAQTFLDYIDERAGLLVGQGGSPSHPSTYRFPHRTFQEYLAGCYLVEQRQIGRVFRQHAAKGEGWNLVAELGAEELYYNRRRVHECFDLAEFLCRDHDTGTVEADRAVVWSGKIAILIGREQIEVEESGSAYLKGVIPRLQAAMEGPLPAPERVDAGNVLAQLGDPRFRGAQEWHLPSDSMLGFVKIESGPFWMGSDPTRDPAARASEQPQHRVHLSTYYLARYPVTVAQFRAFIEASGYEWGGQDRPQGGANHPVVWVSWDDAMAYCRWLTETLRSWSKTPEVLREHLEAGGGLRLPSEAEWEKAARGDDGRVYPWGDEPNADLANYAATGIGGISSVGCFSGGERPYEIYDLSGNVFEWCLDWFDDDYYQQSPDHNPTGPDTGAGRVFRGGAWSVPARFVRAASRSWDDPGSRDQNLGFRCLSSEGEPRSGGT